MESNLVAGELTIGGRQRTFTIRLPHAAPPDREVPLALVLHGNHPNFGGQLMREWTTFDHQADTWGWAIAYPDGHQGSWADGRGVTRADETDVDDVTFLRTIINWSADHHNTTPDQAVVAGISNGAFMAHRLAMAASAQVAVVAAVAGGLPAALQNLRPTHAVSAILIHGTADQVAPIDGGYSRHRGPNGERRGRTLSLEETATHWRTINQCPPTPTHTHTTKSVTRTTWPPGTGNTQVTTRTIQGGGHTWPGTPPSPNRTDPTTQEFDAAEEICYFATPLLSKTATARRL